MRNFLAFVIVFGGVYVGSQRKEFGERIEKMLLNSGEIFRKKIGFWAKVQDKKVDRFFLIIHRMNNFPFPRKALKKLRSPNGRFD